MNGWRPIAVCVLLAGCAREQKDVPDASPLAAGPVRLIEQEPNDRPDQAQVLTDSSIVEAGLSADPSKPDEDWYLLAPAAPKTVDLTVSGIPGVDVAIEVYDTDRNRLALVNSEGDGKPEHVPIIGHAQGSGLAAGPGGPGPWRVGGSAGPAEPGGSAGTNDASRRRSPATYRAMHSRLPAPGR